MASQTVYRVGYSVLVSDRSSLVNERALYFIECFLVAKSPADFGRESWRPSTPKVEVEAREGVMHPTRRVSFAVS